VAALLSAVPFDFAHWPLAFFGDFGVGSVTIALVAYLTLGVIFRPVLPCSCAVPATACCRSPSCAASSTATNNDNRIAASLMDGDGRRPAVLIAAIAVTGATALVIRRRLGRGERVALDAIHLT
jgi:hypothetical protein